MYETSDADIRYALHLKKLSAYHSNPDSIVVDELGLVHARVRIDVAVIDDCIHGFEIKSGMDSLCRLPAQLDLYAQCLERLTIVCDRRHVDKAASQLPSWCGMIEVTKGARGAITFKTLRRTAKNPNVSGVQLAHLLWKNEALILLERCGIENKVSKVTRKTLYSLLADALTVEQLTEAIRGFMKARLTWRYRLEHA